MYSRFVGLDGLHRELLEHIAEHGLRSGAGCLLCGVETRTAADHYFWDGQRRAGDAQHPMAILQYTLDGWGTYTAGQVQHRVSPGRMFVAIVPSAHQYFLPPESSHWTHFFLIVSHDYVVDRLARARQRVGPVLGVSPDSSFMLQLIQTWKDTAGQSFRDALAPEQAAFNLMIEFERLVQQTLHPEEPRLRLLEQTRQYVSQHLEQPLAVQVLAERAGMSRSHYSHHFKATTGLSPARFITTIRLDTAARQLTRTRDKLETIARRCGFADANHFCKVFRRHYHMSPGEFRRQLA